MTFFQFQSPKWSLMVSRRVPGPISFVLCASGLIFAQPRSGASPSVRPTPLVRLKENTRLQSAMCAGRWNLGTRYVTYCVPFKWYLPLFMINPKQLPAQLFVSCQVKYETYFILSRGLFHIYFISFLCHINLSVGLFHIYFILSQVIFSFFCPGYFHSLAYLIFISLPDLFSFLCLAYFHFLA